MINTHVKYLQEKIQAVIDSYPKTYVTVLKHSQRNLLDGMLSVLPKIFNDDRFAVRTKVHYFMNNIAEPKRCPVCNNVIYRLDTATCSVKCAQRTPEVREKIKRTNLKNSGTLNGHGAATRKLMRKNSIAKYGVAHHTQNKKFQQQRRIDALQRYGVEHAFQAEEIKNKIKQTNLERYGVENPFQSEEIKAKIKQTHLDRYGVEHPQQSVSVRNKTQQTCLKRYGVNVSSKSNIVKNKIKQTCQERYGVDYSGQADIKKQRTALTNLKKYGATTYAASDAAKQRYTADFYTRVVNTNTKVKTKFNIDEFKHAIAVSSDLCWYCNECNSDFTAPLNYNWWRYHGHAAYARCPTCYPPLIVTSTGETELTDFVSTLTDDVLTNNRTIIAPYEIDIYSPLKHIAIEFNGLYWHSDINKSNRNYHLNKTEACEQQGIHLIHIFENEWLYKQDIVKSRLMSLFNSDAIIKVNARQCKIIPITSAESCKFLLTNHLQGSTNASIRLGLFYKDELISVMTFSKPRFSKKYEYELVRFCNKLNHSVIGAAGKLLAYFEKTYNPKSIVSYADRRWSYSKKNVYQQLGFALSHASGPNYWYWKGDEFSSRVKYQKHKLPALLENFDENLTESENMYNNGYHRIFDCGNLVYVK